MSLISGIYQRYAWPIQSHKTLPLKVRYLDDKIVLGWLHGGLRGLELVLNNAVQRGGPALIKKRDILPKNIDRRNARIS
jgi:hypothetical protein